MCRVTAASGVSVLNVLYTLGLVWVWEPVLAHVQVIAKAAGASCHEDLGDGEGRHGCGSCDVGRERSRSRLVDAQVCWCSRIGG
jgi:hypothetical protein